MRTRSMHTYGTKSSKCATAIVDFLTNKTCKDTDAHDKHMDDMQ